MNPGIYTILCFFIVNIFNITEINNLITNIKGATSPINPVFPMISPVKSFEMMDMFLIHSPLL